MAHKTDREIIKITLVALTVSTVLEALVLL